VATSLTVAAGMAGLPGAATGGMAPRQTATGIARMESGFNLVSFVKAEQDLGASTITAVQEKLSILRAQRVIAARAARRAAARRAARRAAARRAAARRAAARRAATTPAPSSQPSGPPQQIAASMLGSFGWPSSQFSCLDTLWEHESGWNPYAMNPTTGAYGIPQALPGSKMSTAGPDWQSNPATQIKWGLGYIKADYGSPCAALSHQEATGWY
jgi:Transglycosylase SLT domain